LEPANEYENPKIVSLYDPSFFNYDPTSAPSIVRQKGYTPVESFRAMLTDRSSFVITGGTDSTIRFWDVKDPKNSYIISGPKREHKMPIYANLYNKESHIELLQENWKEISGSNDKIPLLKSIDTHHTDAILDLKLLESPHNMLVSCSRDGVIKVWK